VCKRATTPAAQDTEVATAKVLSEFVGDFVRSLSAGSALYTNEQVVQCVLLEFCVGFGVCTAGSRS
jgi:hypothetical protein